MEGHLEGEFKDFITRKRWLGGQVQDAPEGIRETRFKITIIGRPVHLVIDQELSLH